MQKLLIRIRVSKPRITTLSSEQNRLSVCYNGMKSLFIIIALLFQAKSYAQQNVTISFQNDYGDVYRLSLIIYTPDGKNQTRVGEVEPSQIKTYSFPVGTEIYVADWKQEAFAMKGNDIRTTGVKPTFVLTDSKRTFQVALSSLKRSKEAENKE